MYCFKYLCLTFNQLSLRGSYTDWKTWGPVPETLQRYLSAFISHHLHDFGMLDAQARECLFNDA